MSKTFALGDCHGAYRALIQCLKRSKFNYKKDTLVVLGDICDGYPEVYECVEELMKVKNLMLVIGNHDRWALEWMKYGTREYIWTSQGGLNTIKSYSCKPKLEEHIKFFENSSPYLIDESNYMYVHGGFNPSIPIEHHSEDYLMWDRDLFKGSYQRMKYYGEKKFTKYNKVFIGHTTTQIFEKDCKPMRIGEIINLDTGAGWNGKLTIMNVDSEEYYQSDFTSTLYPEEKGRK